MSAQPPPRPDPLTVPAIVDAACTLIADSGLAALTMRRLGAALGVDPMAVYHHIPNKRELLSLVTARVVGEMSLPGGEDPWEARVRGWARAYWDVVVAHRDLVLAGLADPAIAAGGIPAVAPLGEAIAASGIDPTLVEPNTWLVVDFVHGAALGAGAPMRHPDDDREHLLAAFDAGLDTILAGIGERARR